MSMQGSYTRSYYSALRNSFSYPKKDKSQISYHTANFRFLCMTWRQLQMDLVLLPHWNPTERGIPQNSCFGCQLCMQTVQYSWKFSIRVWMKSCETYSSAAITAQFLTPCPGWALRMKREFPSVPKLTNRGNQIQGSWPMCLSFGVDFSANVVKIQNTRANRECDLRNVP